MDGDDSLSGAAVAKLLASCNKSTRDRALRRLNTFLCSPLVSTSVSDEELLKIWKGLFYSVWHADKLPVQVDLIDRLSSLLSSLDLSLAARYFQAFLATIRREWSGIDHLRLDKFYLLIRRFVNKFFRFMSDNKWDADTVQLMVNVFEKTSLFLVDDKYPSQGVNYHISQVYLDEMIEFLPLSIGIVESLIRPFFQVIETSRDKVLIKKVKDNVFDRLLRCGVNYLQTVKKSMDNGEVEVEKEIEKLGKVAFSMGFAKRFFASASAQGTLQGNRKVLFALHQRFLKMEKDLETSGIKVLIEEVEEGAGQVDIASVEKSCNKKKFKNASRTVGNKSKKKKKSIDYSGPIADVSTASAFSPINEGLQSSKEVNVNALVSETTISKKLKNDLETDDAMQVDVPSERNSSKKKKSKNASSTSGSKSKKGNKSNNGGVIHVSLPASGNLEATEKVNGVTEENDVLPHFDEVLMSNLQTQFEKIAAEAGMVTPSSKIAKKRKRSMSAGMQVNGSNGHCDKDPGVKSEQKSAKTVRFSMKNNLVWKPQTPLPPERLRLPPSTIPRGSALKKGIPPGPVRKSPPSGKKKVRSNAKTSQKSARGVALTIKRPWK